MNSPDEKLVTMATALRDRTEKGQVPWIQTQEPGVFEYRSPAGVVLLSGPSMRRQMLGHLHSDYTFEIRDTNGQLVGSLVAPVTHGSVATLANSWPAGTILLGELYRAVESATKERTSQVIDGILDHLDHNS